LLAVKAWQELVKHDEIEETREKRREELRNRGRKKERKNHQEIKQGQRERAKQKGQTQRPSIPTTLTRFSSEPLMPHTSLLEAHV
jgi:hypothetical protein